MGGSRVETSVCGKVTQGRQRWTWRVSSRELIANSAFFRKVLRTGGDEELDLTYLKFSRSAPVVKGRNVKVMRLIGKPGPHHKTIADFRRDNGAGIRNPCAQFLELCCRIGMLKGDCVTIDGSKCNAVNHFGKDFPKGKITRGFAHPEADVGRYINEIILIDRQKEGDTKTNIILV